MTLLLIIGLFPTKSVREGNQLRVFTSGQNLNLYFWLGLLPFFVSLILTIFILIFFQFLPPRLPLFYSLPWGEQQLANHQQFFIIPASIILIDLINLALIWHLHSSQVFFKKLLSFTSFITTLIFLITFIRIFLIFA